MTQRQPDLQPTPPQRDAAGADHKKATREAFDQAVAQAIAGQMPTSGPLVDTFGRVHTDLRISLTDR
ncbi:MAG: GTP 3',8-cyclase MoaA, partial [Mycobacterium sp.]